MKLSSSVEAKQLLDRMNLRYTRVLNSYEKLFWRVNMGETSLGDSLEKAKEKRDAFSRDEKMYEQVCRQFESSGGATKTRLKYWKTFFEFSRIPQKLIPLQKKMMVLENKILKKRNTRKEGYADPYTKKFIKQSLSQMLLKTTHDPDEKVRRACYQAMEHLAKEHVKDYVELVNLRNQFAQAQGYPDFFAYKLDKEEGMAKQELWNLFDTTYEKTKWVFDEIELLSKTHPGMNRPWNFQYMTTGSDSRETDRYYPVDEVLRRWGQSFSNCGFTGNEGSIKMDLFDRKNKEQNPFCHNPKLVHCIDGVWQKGEVALTCTGMLNQSGAGERMEHVLFHEGGHAMHFLNSRVADAIVNHEYPPTSTAWMETQSMFIDQMHSSPEWKMRYARDRKGEVIPKKQILDYTHHKQLRNIMFSMWLMSLSEFERRVYEAENLSVTVLEKISREVSKKYGGHLESQIFLNKVHVYVHEYSCSYHAYWLAQLALTQWREYFYKKYGYIVDNPAVGREMRGLWNKAGTHNFSNFMTSAVGKKPSAAAYVRQLNRSVAATRRLFSQRIKQTEDKVEVISKKINIKADISMWHGTKKICDNRKSFEDMCERYAAWITRDL